MKIPLDKLITNTKKINKNNKFNSIFLSTDSQEVVEKFQQEFANIITTPKWFPPSGERMHQNWDQCPDRVQNGIEALMDMYLLASCNDLIFSSQSSFGLVASILSKASKQHLHDVNSSSFIEKVKAKIRGIAK
jgi:broad specificity phosphatase PhoE